MKTDKILIRAIQIFVMIAGMLFISSGAWAELKLESVSKTLGMTGQDMEVTLTGTGFDQNTKVLMFPDVWNKRKMLGSLEMTDSAWGITVSGGLAFVADGEKGLQIADVNDPAHPVIIKSVDTPGYANGVAVSGNTAFVADQKGGLQLVDISDPRNAHIVKAVSTSNAWKVAVSGNIAFVADDTGGLKIIAANDPANAQVIKSVATSQFAFDVAVSGTAVFLACGTYDEKGQFVGTGSLKIVDVSDPYNAYSISSIELPSTALGLTVSGNTVFVADMTKGLQIVDVTDRGNPHIVGTTFTPGNAVDVVVSGNTAYVADWDAGLQIIDVTDFSNPKNIGWVQTSSRALDIWVSDNKAYTACGDTDDWNGLEIIDVKDPDSPATVIGSTETPGGGGGLAVSGNTVLISDGNEDVQIINVSDPQHPEIIKTIDITSGEVYGLAMSDNTALSSILTYLSIPFFGEVPQAILQAIDISRLDAPVIKGSISMDLRTFPIDIAMSGSTGIAACAGLYGGELKFIDMSNPGSIRMLSASVPMPAHALGVDISEDGDTAFAACNNFDYSSFILNGELTLSGAGSLQIVDISNLDNPKIISSLNIPNGAIGVEVVGDIALMADPDRNLELIDISDLEHPAYITSFRMPAPYTFRAKMFGDLLFLSDRKGLEVVSISVPVQIPLQPENIGTESISLTLPDPRIPGHYTIRVFNGTESYEIAGAVTFAPSGKSKYVPDGQTVEEALRSKAIIVAGTGPGAGVPDIWKETKLCADAAYRALHWRGYTDDDIYYLTWESDDQKIPTDGIPSKSSLRDAVSTWAASGDPQELLLYLVDHGGDGIFKIAQDEEITVGELDGWLDSLQNTMPGQVIFIYEACRSGTFLTGPDGSPRFAPPTGKERIVITSSTSDEDTLFKTGGMLSFSAQFWYAVFMGMNLNQAFSVGRDMIRIQTPLLDANGNGKANEIDDKSRASRGLRREYEKDSVKPRVENLSDSRKTLNGETSLTLRVRVKSENDITKVWAVILPPDYSSEDSSAVTDLPEAELQDPDKDGIYETNYTDLGTAGTYIFSVYASDVKDYISLPAQMLVTQLKGNALSKADSSEQKEGGDDTSGGAAVAVINGGTVYHNFHEPGDTDYVKFYALSGKTYQIRITSPSLICNVSIEIYDTDGVTKLTDAKDDYGAGEDEVLEWDCRQNGIYYARINNADPDIFGANTNYRLEVRIPTGPDTGRIVLAVKDSVSDKPVGNAMAKAGDYPCVSGSDGNCEIIPQVGAYQLTVDADGYESSSPISVTVDKGSNNIVEKNIVLTPKRAAAPVFSPPPGEYNTVQHVTMSCSTADTVIHYTADGSTPTKNSPLYESPVEIKETVTLKAVGFREGFAQSPVTEGIYIFTPKIALPVFSPKPGSYIEPQKIEISSDVPGAVIRYTTDGSSPTQLSPGYTAPVPVSETVKIKAKACKDGYLDSDVAEGTYIIEGTVATPVFSPLPGIYTASQLVRLSCATPDVFIRYTTDGTDPTEYSMAYNNVPVSVSKTLTVKAAAYRKIDGKASGITSGEYIISLEKTAPPIFSPPPGEYSTVQHVTMSCSSADTVIHYTADGNTPTKNSPLYESPVEIAETVTLKAVGFREGFAQSSVTEGKYIFTPKIALPVFSPKPGTYSEPQQIVISSDIPGAVIRYTTNGNSPTELSLGYADPVSVSETLTLKAIAHKDGYLDSDVAEGTYIIEGTVATPVFSPEPGIYTASQLVRLSCATPDVVIFYTTDGNDPTESSADYNNVPISVSKTLTLKAVAYRKTDRKAGGIATGEYVIDSKGDIDGDGSLKLKDAILAFQLMIGKTISSSPNIQADVNADGRIGMPEAVYIMRKLLH